MASYDDNVYYHPEKSGLATLGEVEWSDGAYSFDLTVAWRHQDGRLFWGEDAGCSCPSPFEDVNSLDELATGSAADLQAALDERNKGNYGGDRSAQIAELMGAVVK